MTSERILDLTRKLERNKIRVQAAFENIPAEGWNRTVYENPAVWTARDLLAHFASAEKELRMLAENIAAGGAGAPEGFDYNEFNRREQEACRKCAPEELLRMFLEARDANLQWVNNLDEEQLDSKGRHPAMGEVTLEALLTAIHGHILLHLKELKEKGKNDFYS
jgi:hypothetical protein